MDLVMGIVDMHAFRSVFDCEKALLVIPNRYLFGNIRIEFPFLED